ncbi:CLUMA_CG001911, isoform A [Clunio marinus]|uniref:CLUMA_CG001911, isoform A n=1 Tax=Clunio marinus TaxID=568069 RepID=A0A1J1HNT1_9DIPT|nr:CLUMA_CG001911, isoform A [Clunio marinus]
MDLRFASEANHKHIQQLYPLYQFQVNVETFHGRGIQSFNFSFEKLDGIVQLRISDVVNQSKMYLCTIDNITYQEIKTEQSLQVAFQGFIDHLITILDSCRKNELFISLIQSQNSFILQFYEKRSLKNLIHLFLRVNEAPPAIIMYHLNLSITHLKDEVSSINQRNQYLDNEVNKRDFHIEEQQKEIATLKNKVAENENMILFRTTEEIQRLQQEIKRIETSKEFEENRLRALVKSFETKVDQLTKDNFSLNEKIQLEVKKSETLKHEVEDMKRKLTAMSTDNNRLKNNLSQFDAKDKQQRMKVDELNQQMADTLEKLRSANKETSNLQAEIEAEKQICHTKKRALQIATDELTKNHETIKRYEKNVEKLKKGIEWRSLLMMRINYENQRNLVNVEQSRIKQN